MARSTLSDVLQDSAFWLFDVAPIDPLALPIFSPLIGFSAITAPELNIEHYEVNQANWYYAHHVVQRASASSITMSRASRWTDSNFYNWAMAALTGDTGGALIAGAAAAVPRPLVGPLNATTRLGGVTPRRNLLLIHFLAHSPSEATATAALAALGLLASTVSGGGAASASLAATVSAAASLGAAGTGPFEFAPRIPGKAWLLYGCLPTRYKAGSDFDATSGQVSIQELEVSVEYFDEISLSSV